jgi:hypothetical protein
VPPARFLAAIAVVASAFALSGCRFGSGAAKPAAGVLTGAADLAGARKAAIELTPELEKVFARSVFLPRAEARPTVTVHTEADAAEVVERKPLLKDAAEASAADVDSVARKRTTTAPARAKVKACAKAGMSTALQKYGKEWVLDRPPPDFEVTISQSASTCVQKAFPKQAPLAKVVGQELTNAMLARSNEVSRTNTSAQEYVDWLIHTATLSAQADVPEAPADTAVDDSPVDRSVTDLVVILLHAHYGRLEVRQKHWAAAIANRNRVLVKLAHLEVAPELEHSHDLLTRAMQTSLKSDHAHDSQCRCAARLDHRATAQKRAFIRAFHPYFTKRYTGHIEPADI